MKYSVIIPCFNTVQTLENTVHSVMKSGLDDYEIILVDDGSEDDTLQLCLRLEREIPNIRCYHQKNTGVSAARNRGLLEAQGEYVWFFDSDDNSEPMSMERTAPIIENYSPDILFFGMRFDYYKRGVVYRKDVLQYAYEGLLNMNQLRDEFQTLYESNSLSSVCNKLIKRSLIVENEIRFCEELIVMEDFLFVLECLCHCESVYSLNSTIYHYRQTEDERGAFRRLWRISSLAEYMQPFQLKLEELEYRFEAKDLQEGINNFTDKLFAMLFWQKIRFANPRQIRLAAEDMFDSPYSGGVRDSDTKLFQLLSDSKYAAVWERFLYSRLHHRIAVEFKYLKRKTSAKYLISNRG